MFGLATQLPRPTAAPASAAHAMVQASSASAEEMEVHLRRLETQGFTVVPGAIPPHQLRPIRAAFDGVCATIRASKKPEHWSIEAGNIDGAVDFFRAYELSPAFECLMDHPSVFPILAAALRDGRGDVPGEPRLRDPVAQFMPGHTEGGRWHRDGFNIRLTYILDDLEADGGGTACVSGSHKDKQRGRADLLPLPEWFREHPLGSPQDAPADSSRPVVIPLADMPAGSCMINWTSIIHRRTDNQTDSPRRTFWQVFCRPDFNLGDRLCGHLSAEYRAAQTIPTRIALMDDSTQRGAGRGYWRLEELDESHKTWPYRLDDIIPQVRRGAAL